MKKERLTSDKATDLSDSDSLTNSSRIPASRT